MTETRGGMVEGRRAASLRSQALAAVEEQGLALPAAADLPATLAADLAKLRLFCGEFSNEDGLGTLGISYDGEEWSFSVTEYQPLFIGILDLMAMVVKFTLPTTLTEHTSVPFFSLFPSTSSMVKATIPSPPTVTLRVVMEGCATRGALVFRGEEGGVTFTSLVVVTARHGRRHLRHQATLAGSLGALRIMDYMVSSEANAGWKEAFGLEQFWRGLGV